METVFRIASLAKPIAAAAVLMLVDEGTLGLVEAGWRGSKPADCLAGSDGTQLLQHTFRQPDDTDQLGIVEREQVSKSRWHVETKIEAPKQVNLELTS